MCVPESPTNVAGTAGDNFVRLSDVPKELRPKEPKKKKITATELLKEIRQNEELAGPGKMERCIQHVKAQLNKSGKTLKDQSIKSAAIAICRARLKQ